MNWLARLIVTSAEKEYSRATKGLFTAWGLVVWELVVPATLILAGIGADRLLGLRLDPDPDARWVVGGAAFILGQVFILWTLADQVRLSGGTPAFKAPPKRLLVSGPFAWCRNPMVFGYLLYYYGLAFAVTSPVALLGLFPALHLLALSVIVHVEEVELEQRFGPAYLAYKSTVNRLLPLPPSRRSRLGASRPPGEDAPQPGV